MKLEEVRAMSDDELRIKVAELCGWKNIKPWTAINHGQFFGLSPDKVMGATVPDYPHDLNAMHEAESFMDHSQERSGEDYIDRRTRWLANLSLSVGGLIAKTYVCRCNAEAFVLARATARQRAEAFVLTME